MCQLSLYLLFEISKAWNISEKVLKFFGMTVFEIYKLLEFGKL